MLKYIKIHKVNVKITLKQKEFNQSNVVISIT